MDRTQAILDAFQTDLRTLSAEAKKKHPPLKDAAERALMKLHAIGEQKELDQDKFVDAISKSDEVIKPYLLACDSKVPKLISIAISALQKMIVYKAVSLSNVPKIMTRLSSQINNSEENIQLKVLQALVALATTLDLHDQQLADVLCVCFRLQANKQNFAVHNTAAASLRQLLTMLFDRAMNELKATPVPQVPVLELETTEKVEETTEESAESPRGEEEVTVMVPPSPSVQREEPQPPPRKKTPLDSSISHLPPFSTDAYLLVADICTMTGGDPPDWLEIETIPKTFGLELIESVLNSHSRIFLEVPEFSLLLKDRICPVVIKTFRMSTDFPSVLRLIRIVSSFIRHFSGLLVTDCEVFIAKLIKMMDHNNSLWNQTIAVEVFKGICENSQVVSSIYKNYDHEHDHKSAKIFHQIVSSLGSFAQTMFTWDNALIAKNVQIKSRYLDLLNLVEPPTVNENYVVSIAVDSLVGVANAIAKIAESEEENAMAVEMASFSWPTLLGSLSTLLDKTSDELLIQDIMKGIVTFTHVCAVLHLATPRDALLTSLTKFTIPRAAPTEGADIVFSFKNTHALKALIQIAHTDMNNLELGWSLVLENFQQLDRILHSKPGSSDVPASVNAELNNLVTSLESLVKTTSTCTDQALRDILSSFKKISIDSIKTNKPRPLFAATKIIEITNVNVARIVKYWDIISEHLIDLTSKEVPVRNFAVDAITHIIANALAVKMPQVSYFDTPLALQDSFFGALEKLAQSPVAEIQEKSLQTMYQILHSSGQSLSTAWPTILSMLSYAAHSPEKAHVILAFKAVQLICTDFLPFLTKKCLAQYVVTVGAFGVQKVDLNITLTAINLLWNFSDFLAQESQKKNAVSSVAEQIVEEVISVTMETVVEKQMQEELPTVPLVTIETLWITMFNQMKQLSSDPRYETRNCAVQTLLKILQSHGDLLNKETWIICVEKIMFALSLEIRNAAASASNEDFAEAKGNAKLMVHHTRNTESKQWAETVVLAISGITRVFKIYFTTLILLPEFPTYWKRLLDEIYVCSVHRSAEISTGGIQSALELISSQAGNEQFTKNLWEESWEIVEKAATIVTDREKGDQSVVQALGTSLSQAYAALHKQFEVEDYKRLLRMLRPVALFTPDTENDISDIQRDIFITLAKIPTTKDNFPYVITELLIYLSFVIGYSFSPSSAGQNGHVPKFVTVERKYLPLAQKSLLAIVDYYSKTEPDMRTLLFEDVTKVLGAAMGTKYSVYQSPLWRLSVESFIKSVQLGLHDLNRSDISSVQANILWTELVDSMHVFLFNDERDKIPYISQEIVQRDDAIDISLVDLIANDMLGQAGKVPLMHERLVDLLIEGTSLVYNNREPLAVGCYKNLFYLCANGGQEEDEFSCHMKLAKMVMPILMRKCREVLNKFISDEKKSGTLPAARSRLAEISFILQQLRVLELHPDVDLDTEVKSPLVTGKKRHLLLLFPLLCDCITTKENSLKEILKDLFHETAKAVGLE